MADEKTGLDIGKLLGSAKKPVETKPTETAAPAPATAPPPASTETVQLKGKLSFSAPQKTPPAAKAIGVGGQRAVGQVGQAGAVHKTAAGPLSAPTQAPQKERALNAPAPGNKKLEQQMSTKGAKQDRLNVVQKEARKYPLGFFGVDEIFLCLAEVVNVLRVNVWRALETYPKFIVALESIGSVRRQVWVAWNGEALSPILEAAPEGEPTFIGALDADDIIDHMRGKISCREMEIGPQPQLRGDTALARTLHILHLHTNITDEQREAYLEIEAAKAAKKMQERARCKTPLEWLERAIALQIEDSVRFIEEPIFFRVTLEGEPKQEMLFHIEKKKLTTLVGKPGEALVAGAVEVTVTQTALQALWDMECAWPFLFSAAQIKATGDLDLLSRLRWVNPEIVRRLRIYNRLQKVMGPDSPDYWLEVRKTKPATLRPG